MGGGRHTRRQCGPPGSDLTGEARRLLVEASKDTNGQIIQFSVMAGWGIQVNGNVLNKDGGARTVAKWTSALEDLEKRRLIRPLGSKREIFELTDADFTLADKIRPFVEP